MTDIDQYRSLGYVALPRLFDPLVVGAFYERLRAEVDLDNKAPHPISRALIRPAVGVYAADDPQMIGLLWGLTPRIALIADCDLLPTYAYFRLYRRGDICRVHSDRPACEHSVSLMLASSDSLPWSLSVATAAHNTRTGATDDFEGLPFASVAMTPGDAVMYQGIARRHGRLDPNPNAWSAHLFLHWIDANGPYRAEAFDQPAMERARDRAKLEAMALEAFGAETVARVRAEADTG